MHQHIVKFFLRCASADSLTLDQLPDRKDFFYSKEGYLIFSVASLHDFFNQFAKEKITYQQFQQQLYNSTLNQTLKEQGMQIVVHHATGKVKSNLYRLEPYQTDDAQGVQ